MYLSRSSPSSFKISLMICVKSGCLFTICPRRVISFAPFWRCFLVSLMMCFRGKFLSRPRAKGTMQ